MAGHVAERLAEFVAETEYADVPEEGVRTVERAFVDTVGVTLPGTAEPAAEKTRAVFAHGGEASVLGTDRDAPADAAALVNATAGHALDYDDVVGEVWHPSVTLVAPALAVGESAGASGRALVTAFAVGFETETYLGRYLLPAHYERGWHSTPTLGVFGATAAAASLLGLDTDSARHAFELAASMPSGLKANFGTMTKPLHPGLSSRAGVTAARLAAEGFTAAEGAIDGELGFLDLYAGEGGPATDVTPPGDPWTLVTEGIRVKKYPCCYFTHSSVAAAQHLAADHDIAPGDVERVAVGASKAADTALHYSDPDTGLEGKFSMEYTVASGIVRDRLGLDAFTDDAVADPTVDAVRERVTFAVDPDIPDEGYSARVEIETTDGERYTRFQERPPGTPANPLSDEALRAKFEDCVAHGPDVAPGAAYDLLDGLRDVDSVTTLTAALRPE
ncbi:MmgE/PrpD family protein [Halorientalis litorea]|uniref:MmgE/PrpD family protein n=1 Tax=Halorientalis litorea TaxID=2931977 RepID=UPI001FF6C239|nr:MmgE/PrpD family protein [Halorientalis litorea]